MRETIQGALHRGLELLQDRQQPHGEIAAFRYRDDSLVGFPSFESSPYATTYVLHALEQVVHSALATRAVVSRSKALTARARAFLAEEMEPPGLWRYYSSRNSKCLAPDLDDSACASFALREVHDVIRLGLNFRLFLANRDENGLFRTFLSSGANNVDAVVNANVLLYLGEREETRATGRYLVEITNEGEVDGASLYGLNELSFAYVLSRAYHQGAAGLADCRAALTSRVLERRQQDGSFGDPFDTALAVNSLLNLGRGEPDLLVPTLRSLLAAQGEDGSWPRAAFFIDFYGGYYGSEELTTAFCLEALARAGQLVKEVPGDDSTGAAVA